MNNRKTNFSSIAFAAALAASTFMLPSLATASVVTVDINLALPHSGVTFYDIDGDATNDIGLSEDCCAPNRTYVSGVSSTKWQYAWMNAGQVVDNSLAWVSGTAGYTPTAPMLPGLNYLAISNTSMGNYFGYATIDFQLPTVGTGGYSQTLKSYTYDNSGAGITVGAVVPEPASLGLFGVGLLGLVCAARRKKAVKA